MESIALRIEPYESASHYRTARPYDPYAKRYTLAVSPDANQPTQYVQMIVDQTVVHRLPREVVARELVEKMVSDYRARLLKKVLSVL